MISAAYGETALLSPKNRYHFIDAGITRLLPREAASVPSSMSFRTQAGCGKWPASSEEIVRAAA
jgi:hypothetical protein